MQNILTAGNATSNLSTAAGDDGTFKIVVGPNGSQVDGISVDAAGQPTFKKPPKSTDVASMVRVDTSNGYGSTNTFIKRFANVRANQGSDITYADSATLGASFTINTAGVYSISYNDQASVANQAGSGISLNTTQPATSILSISNTEVLNYCGSGSASIPAVSAWTGYLAAGAVIRPHTGGISTVNTNMCHFTITRVA